MQGKEGQGTDEGGVENGQHRAWERDCLSPSRYSTENRQHSGHPGFLCALLTKSPSFSLISGFLHCDHGIFFFVAVFSFFKK